MGKEIINTTEDWISDLKSKISIELNCSEDELIIVRDSSCIAECVCFNNAPEERNDKIIFESMIFDSITKDAYVKARTNHKYFHQFRMKNFPDEIVKLDSLWGPVYLVLEAYPWLIMKAPFNFDKYYI